VKMHLRIKGVDARSQGQTDYEYSHQTACGYVRSCVTPHKAYVDCKLCVKSEHMKETKSTLEN